MDLVEEIPRILGIPLKNIKQYAFDEAICLEWTPYQYIPEFFYDPQKALVYLNDFITGLIQLLVVKKSGLVRTNNSNSENDTNLIKTWKL